MYLVNIEHIKNVVESKIFEIVLFLSKAWPMIFCTKNVFLNPSLKFEPDDKNFARSKLKHFLICPIMRHSK